MLCFVRSPITDASSKGFLELRRASIELNC